MRIVCLLNWFEESPAWLGGLTAACARFCDHIVAVDGAYFIFDAARARSGTEQAEAIREAAYATGIGCTIHAPAEPWAGDQVEKINMLFALGSLAAGEDGWLYQADADDLPTDVPHDLRARLAATEFDAGEVTYWHRDDPHAFAETAAFAREVAVPHVQQEPLRRFFRNLPGLRCEGAHYIYAADKDGHTVYLRGGRRNQAHLEPALNLRDMRVEHRHSYRSRERAEQQKAYYQLRGELGIETNPLDLVNV